MTVDVDLDALAAVIRKDSDKLLARWRDQVRQLPSATNLAIPILNDHIPQLLGELAVALLKDSDLSITNALRAGSAPAHGLQRLENAYDIEEIVAEYNILRGCIHDLADENGITLQGRGFHILNRVLDSAIGIALQTYATQRALEVQQRREEYLAFVAHDLRTPLNAISLSVRVLEATIPAQESVAGPARMLNALHRGVRQLEGLVAKVLEENSNMETETGVKLEQRRFDLWPLVEGLIHDLHPVAGTSSTALINDVPTDLVVYADAGLLRRIVQNLIANAIEHTPRGKVVIEARALPDGAGTECSVSDSGSGIPEDALQRVFEKGESQHDSADGKGLGLAIVKTFVEAHGGEVTVTSREGVGSQFRFTLPETTE